MSGMVLTFSPLSESGGLNLIGSRLLSLSKNSEVSFAGVAGIFKPGVRSTSLCLPPPLDVGEIFKNGNFVDGESTSELSDSLFLYRVLLSSGSIDQ